MPRATLKLIPGVDTNKTPLLNETAVSYSDNVRFIPDRSGLGLVQKIGGWTKVLVTTFTAPVRALKAWSDLENTKYLAIGGEGPVGAQVFSPDDNSLRSVTPRKAVDNIMPDGTNYGFRTAAGSTSVRLYTSATLPNSNSYVYFPTGISLGNITLTGPYRILTIGTGYYSFAVPEVLTPIAKVTYTGSTSPYEITVRFSGGHTFSIGEEVYIQGVTAEGYDGSYFIENATADSITVYKEDVAPSAATSTGGTVNSRVEYGGEPPEFETALGQKNVFVTLANHGYSVGSTFNVTVPTTVGNTTLYGLYTVSKVTYENTGISNRFEIWTDTFGTGASGYENEGKIQAEILFAATNTVQPANSLYGGGIYNEGLYGSGAVPVGSEAPPITAGDWSFDNWGSILVGCPRNGALYYWQPVGGNINNLSYMPNAPLYNSGMFVAMPQRQIVAFGSSFGNIQDPLLIRWCDNEDFSIWIAQAINQAGSYRIPTGSRIVGAIQGPQQGLIWTDLDLWSMTYIGPPYIYGFNKLGANAGLISKKAVAQMGGVVYWMSQKQFFKFAGNGVEVIPCPIWDQVFQNLHPGIDTLQQPFTSRIRCAANSQFDEITWYFPAHSTYDIDPVTGVPSQNPVNGNGEVNAYVKYNVSLNQWDYGYQDAESDDVLIGRTAWIDQTVLGPPIGAATTSSVSYSNGVMINYNFEGETVGIAASGGIAKLFFAPNDATFAVGANITISNIIPQAFNGTYDVITSGVGTQGEVSVTAASPAVVTWLDNNLIVDDAVSFISTGTLPTGVAPGVVYYVKEKLTQDTFTLALIPGGDAVNTSGSASVNAGMLSYSWATVANENVGLAVTSTSGNGVKATLTFTPDTVIPAFGTQIVVSGVWPTAYNGTYVVTGSSAGTVQYNSTTTGDMTIPGLINGIQVSPGKIAYSIISYIYQHEITNNADGKAIPSGFTTGYASLTEGHEMLFIDQIWPDMKWGMVDEAKTAKVHFTFYGTNYPGDTPARYGPYTVTQGTEYLSVRIRARYVAFSVSSDDPNSFWRIGGIRYRYQPDGRF